MISLRLRLCCDVHPSVTYWTLLTIRHIVVHHMLLNDSTAYVLYSSVHKQSMHGASVVRLFVLQYS
jgi:hypothetical protein